MLITKNTQKIAMTLTLGAGLSAGVSSYSNLSAEEMELRQSHGGHNHFQNSSDEPSVTGFVGIYGKTSSFASSFENNRFRNDSYSTLYSDILLTNKLGFFDVGVGVSASVPLSTQTGYLKNDNLSFDNRTNNAWDKKTNSQKEEYIAEKFVTNNAYLAINQKIGDIEVSAIAGRFEEQNFEWIGHYIQGAGAHIDTQYLKVYGVWVNEQAHIMRGISTDFDFFNGVYADHDLYAVGADIKLPYVQISPYFYKMKEIYDVYGAKATLNFGDKSDGWHFEGFYSYSRVDALTRGFSDFEAHRKKTGTSNSAYLKHPGPSHYTSLKGTGPTYLSWAQVTLGYEDKVEFGGGYMQVGNSYFELGRMGSALRTEHSHNGEIIRPDGVMGGSQLTNVYLENVKTAYLFANAKVGNNAEVEITARNSNNLEDYKQSVLSLAFKYNFWHNFEVGAIAVHMMKRDRFIDGEFIPEINRSYGKAYLQYNF